MRIVAFVILIVLSTSSAFSHGPNTPTTIESYPLEKISKNIYIVHGPHDLPNEATQGFMNNPAAILTDKGFIVVDPGSSERIGRELVRKLKKVSTKPVIAVFNTHAHGDHWLGNQGIRETYPDIPIYAHRRAIERIESGEGDVWVARFNKMTQGALDDTRVVAPNIGLKGGETLTLGGATLQIYHTGQAHTDNDIMIKVIEDKALFFGDIVFDKRIPNSDVPEDSSFKGNIKAIKTVMDDDIELYIPGHGRSGDKSIPQEHLKFLNELTSHVTRYYNRGLADYEMKKFVMDDLKEYSNWDHFSELGRVISYVYQEVELDNF